MIVMPSGRRSSEPMPVPKASGTAPNSAAIVVIRIGRKRSMQASKIASLGALALLALGLQREIDHHDGVLLDDADQQHDADDGDDVQILPNSISASIAPTLADGSVEMIVSGWTRLSYRMPSTMYTASSAVRIRIGSVPSDCW
jgi:hypothetical protein